jgi:hypothetical protein
MGHERKTLFERRPGLVFAAIAVVTGIVLGIGGIPPLGRLPRVPAAPPRRIGVVNLETVVRAHPRWSELDAINKRIARLQGQFTTMPPVPIPPRAEIQRALDVEAARLRIEFEKELDFLRKESARTFQTFTALLREENQAKFEAARKQLEVDGLAAIDAKRKALDAQARADEQAIMDEYRYPILNLRLRAEVAGLTSEQEGRALLREIQALQEEREKRIRAKYEELDKELHTFQKAQEDEGNVKLESLRATMDNEGRERQLAKQRELEAELKRVGTERDTQFRARLTRRQKDLIDAAEAQVRAQQRAYLSGLDERTRRLRTELTAVEEERLRLEASILADVKVTVAAITQTRNLDVVLTRYLANLSGDDITAAVVQRMKR